MATERRPRVLIVANVLTHYRLPLYEELQERVDLELIFFSDGQEWYWRRTEEPSGETLANARWMRGMWLGRTRIVPALPAAVWRSKADVIIKDPTGKFAIPATYLVARLRRKPFLFWASLSEHPTNGLHRFTRPLLRYLYRRADGVLTYGRHVSRHVIAEGARPDRVIVAPQAVRSFAGAAPDAERWRQPLQLLYVGRLEPWKGLHVLIEALGLLGERGWRLRVAGRGAQEGALRDQARALGIGDLVEFLGHVPNRSLPALYASSAVLIVPSIRTPSVTEVWALVVNEAMQAGALVMASDCIGAVQDGLVRDQQTGMVFREGNPASLAQQLALVTDPASAASLRRIATAGRQEIARYSFDEAAAAFVTAAQRASTGQAVDSRTGSLTGRR